MADFLLGRPQTTSIRFGILTPTSGAAGSVYFQDDWRISSNFTVNAGVRYEVLQPLHERCIAWRSSQHRALLHGCLACCDAHYGRPLYRPVPARGAAETDRNKRGAPHRHRRRRFPRRKLWCSRRLWLVLQRPAIESARPRASPEQPLSRYMHVYHLAHQSAHHRDGFATVPSGKIANTFAVDRDHRLSGYAQTWSCPSEDLPRGLVAEVVILGTKGTRLDIQRIPNRAATGSTLTAEQRRLINNAVALTLPQCRAKATPNPHHAAQLRLTIRRFQRGISVGA